MNKALITYMEQGLRSHAFLALFLLSFILFLITKLPLFGVFTLLFMLVLVVAESVVGVSRHGAKRELLEIFLSIAAAFFVVYGLGILLNTKYPLDSVVSCSMLPHLQRGDFVIVQGTSINAPVFYATEEDIDSIRRGWVSSYMTQVYPLFLSCAFENSTNACVALDSLAHAHAREVAGPFTFHFSPCIATIRERRVSLPCVTEITYNGTSHRFSLESDPMVFEPLPSDTFAKNGVSGIVHRAFVKVVTENATYYITRGDNNPITDLQMGNSLVTENRVHGKVIFRFPFLGYLRLFLAGSFFDQYYCQFVLDTQQS